MTVYDTALSKMVIENNIKSPTDLNTFGQTGTCDNTRLYFKSVQDGFDNCTFRTADGMWWNISEIDKPLISFNEITQDNIDDIRANAADPTNLSAFYLYGWFDSNGNLRVDDPQAATDETIKTYLEALYDYVNGKKATDDTQTSPFSNCDPTQTTCEIDGIVFNKTIFTESLFDDSVTNCYLDEETCIYLKENSKAEEGTYYTVIIGDPEDNVISWNDAASKCAELGAAVATSAQLQHMYYNLGMLDSYDIYYAAEESSDGSSGVSFYGSDNFVDGLDKDSLNGGAGKVVCIGNQIARFV